jgi:galactose-1-phosphate uridylyltransferase
LFLSKKHDLLQITLSEFKDLFNIAIEWFKRVHKSNTDYRFPTIFWDFLPKSGASQVHPHLHGTIDNIRYFGLFEIIRSGAEKYFITTNNNYFTDFASIHNELGLTLMHKDSLLVVPLVNKILS